MEQRSAAAVLIAIAVFAIAMGHVEAVVVYYLRLAVSSTPQMLPLAPLPNELLMVEQTREAATIVMLAAIAIVAGRTNKGKALVFLFAFAIWDILYYVSLHAMLGWPQTLSTVDVLFLIPVRDIWFAPVWVPLSISAIVLVASAVLLLKNPEMLITLPAGKGGKEKR